MEASKAIKFLEKQIKNPSKGLPEEIFLFASRIVPMINVDLLIKDDSGRTLLSWRDDKYCGKGWHLPGGIIRFKETVKERLEKVAKTEIGANVKFEIEPIDVNEIMIKSKTRGHFISLLYRCYLSSNFVPENNRLKETDAGYLKWHTACPNNLLRGHNIYKKFL